MKTKFILHGGFAGKPNSDNDKFFMEILKDAPRKAKVLLVYFAKDKNEYKRMLGDDSLQFHSNKDNKEISLEIAEENSLGSQIKNSDIIYLHGGKTSKLLETLKKYPNFKELIKGKIVAGESAGAYALSSCFYSKSEGGVFKGLGLVPVKTICHYTGENKEKLDECPKNLETLLLADYGFKVFKINL